MSKRRMLRMGLGPGIHLLVWSSLIVVLTIPVTAGTLFWDGTNANVVGPQGGPGTWDALNSNWCRWDESVAGYVNTVWVNGDDVVLSGTGGIVTLGTTGIFAHNMDVSATNYTLRLTGKKLGITGTISGESIVVEENDSKKKGGLVFSADNTFAGSIRSTHWYGWPSLTADGCHMTFDGKWDNGYGSSEGFWFLTNSAVIHVGPNAQINNNCEDLINARSFRIEGTGTNDVLEWDPDFRADHTGYPTNWHNNGLSTINLCNVGMISHHSNNLSTINKKTFSGTNIVYSHHGLITIGKGGSAASWTGVVWTVRGTDQEYDGGINWREPWTLRTETDLTFTGQYWDGAKVAFGNGGTWGSVLTKEGGGALILNGTQGYSTGSVMVVKEGSVVFNTDPGNPGEVYRQINWPGVNPGQYLEVFVSSNGAVEFNSISNRLYSLDSEGDVTLITGRLQVAQGVCLYDKSRLTLQLGDEGRNTPKILADTGVALSGSLVFSWGDPISHGDYVLIETHGADGIAGAFVSVALPEWSRLVTVTNGGTTLRLRVYDPSGDNDGDLIPNAWELTHDLDPDTADGQMDSDGDGVSNYSEYVAGTDPRDASSFLGISLIGRGDSSRLVFPSVTGRTYTVECSTNLLSPTGWKSIFTNLAGTDGNIEVPSTCDVVYPVFYRVRTGL